MLSLFYDFLIGVYESCRNRKIPFIYFNLTWCERGSFRLSGKSTKFDLNRTTLPWIEYGLKPFYGVSMYARMGFMLLMPAVLLSTTLRDSLLSVLVRRIHVVFTIAGFKGGGKPCPKTHETATVRRDIQNPSRTKLGSNPRHWCTSSRFYHLSYPSALAVRIAIA